MDTKENKTDGITVYRALDIREDFIKFFRGNSHKLLAPSKIFNDDPSLLFVNAGMNQLKSEFLKDTDDPNKDEKFKRLCNSQICIRAGGKHNDLDDVGLDSYHLTSFEMLGNWSINSYQKEEAIRLAYSYLTEHLGLNKSKLYVTYFKGDSLENIDADTETKDIWMKYFTPDHIVEGNFKDNFWMMAETGPCGMCTEIHYDLSDEQRTVPELVNKSDPSVIEIWNIVFIQFNRCPDETVLSNVGKYSYHKLNRFFVDTGMGMERLVMVLQKKPSIYKTDVFHYLMGYAQAMTNCEQQYIDIYDKLDKRYNIDCAYRIFCDHFRTVVTALFDGVNFSGEGRGFVLKKIFRRMLTYLYVYLNHKTVEQLMVKPIVLGIISDILNYQLKKTHDEVSIRDKLVAEEKIFLGCLQNFQRKMTQVLELNDLDGCFDYVCRKKQQNPELSIEFTGDTKNLTEVDKLYDKLFNEGVPNLLVTYSRELKIKHLK
jgi:alanyl-tRNA synthetase